MGCLQFQLYKGNGNIDGQAGNGIKEKRVISNRKDWQNPID